MVARWVNRTGRYAAWGHTDTVLGALCPDGKRRTIRLNEAADTYFSHGGRADLLGRTRRGFVTTCETADGEPDTAFMLLTPERIVLVRPEADGERLRAAGHWATADREVTRCGLDVRPFHQSRGVRAEGAPVLWGRDAWETRMRAACDDAAVDGPDGWRPPLIAPCGTCG